MEGKRSSLGGDNGSPMVGWRRVRARYEAELGLVCEQASDPSLFPLSLFIYHENAVDPSSEGHATFHPAFPERATGLKSPNGRALVAALSTRQESAATEDLRERRLRYRRWETSGYKNGLFRLTNTTVVGI
ncbi:hypothetical protein V1477_007566 [Vespula maculifrons]|uniref:Uncharacterized protein n=1 Tax=Vespula maculifrons TaxID=7453 RepID=A0ABD2CJK7_VESMC